MYENLRKLVKTAEGDVEVVPGGPVNRFIASTVGRIPGLQTAALMLSPRMLQNMSVEQATELSNRLANVDPEALEGLRVEVGGTRPLSRIGRVWQNPRLTILGKLLGTVTSPLAATMTNFTRADHYDPFSRSVGIYSNVPAILSHELGHAADFGKRRGIGHDAYLATSRSPLMRPLPEALANIRSRELIETAFKDEPEKLQELLRERSHTLSPAYGSYVGGGVGSAAHRVYMQNLINKGQLTDTQLPENWFAKQKALWGPPSLRKNPGPAYAQLKPSQLGKAKAAFYLPLILSILGGHIYGRATAPSVENYPPGL